MRDFVLVCAATLLAAATLAAQDRRAPGTAGDRSVLREFVEAHCRDCHDATARTAGLALDELLTKPIDEARAPWEGVVRKLTARQMPPSDRSKPDERAYEAVVSLLVSELDAAAKRRPTVARTESLRRLTRTEYRNVIRDLLALDVDVATLLPADESSQGFDNITVTGLSPSLMSRYISAAQKISRMAIGAHQESQSRTYRVRPDITQDHHRVEGLPFGTRGGLVIPHHFTQDGSYQVQVSLMRDRNDEIEGLRGKHTLEVLLDRDRVATFPIQRPPRGQSDRQVDARLVVRFEVQAGRREVGVTFVKKPASLLESERRPLNVHYNFYRHPRLGPAVYQVTITGPLQPGRPGESASRSRVFVRRPNGPADEDDCARFLLSRLMRRAYRRPIAAADLDKPMEFFKTGRAAGGFEAGIERALAAVLVNPHFLFRVERQSTNASPDLPYRITDLELASRLSFFLWSSIPDDELLDSAERNELHQPDVLRAQVLRMLKDKRADSLADNFADQWLHLRNLESFVPDARLYPDFDDNLRQAFRRETELSFQYMLCNDASVLTLIDSPATFLNERLAKHYQIPHVFGSHFRRVVLEEGGQRGGVLRHGGVLAVTSYATRTSPVIRGKWILENLLGSPPPEPPPNIPSLDESSVAADLPVRQRLAAHRAHPTCAACHDVIDPVGFGLENFDAVGRWRDLEQGQPVDASGETPDGRRFEGVGGLEKALLERPELFVRTLTEKLLTFALGRGIEYHDAPAIRGIVRDAGAQNYRFSSLVLGIVKSEPFQMKMAEPAVAERPQP